MKWKLWSPLPALLICVSAFPQSRVDTSFVAAAKSHAIKLHYQALGSQSRLYNGSRYLDPEYSFEEHPFFLSVDWITGSVFYDGEYFEDVALMYDLLNDALVAEHFPSGHAIQLIRDKLRYFTISGHYFERIENESVQNSLPGTGFYDVLYNGKSRLVAKRQKLQREEIEGREVLTSYEERNRYFVLLNGVYFAVKSKGSILKLMDDKKQELKRFIKQEGLFFSDNRERALKSVAEYYDTLQ